MCHIIDIIYFNSLKYQVGRERMCISSAYVSDRKMCNFNDLKCPLTSFWSWGQIVINFLICIIHCRDWLSCSTGPTAALCNYSQLTSLLQYTFMCQYMCIYTFTANILLLSTWIIILLQLEKHKFSSWLY